MTKKTMMLSRQQLYDEIWQVSVAGVARKYNLNYSKLIAKCREANIPFPSSGYWTRKNLGKDVSGEVVALPPADNENVELLLAEVKLEKKKKIILKESIEEPIAEEFDDGTEEDLRKAAVFMEEKMKEIWDEDISASVQETRKRVTIMIPFCYFWTEQKRNVYYKLLLNLVFVVKRDCMNS